MKPDMSQRLRLLGITPHWQLRPQFIPHHTDPVQAQSACTATAGTNSTADVLAQEPGSPDRRTRIMQLDWPDLLGEIRGCQACTLAQGRTQAVPGVGGQRADWLIIGEAPGADEDAQGEPFVGQAGKLLDNMLAAIGLQRGQGVYIANVLKCRPPGNRNPAPDEIAACEPFLSRQIELIQPKVILALGKFAAQWLLDSGESIAALRGRVHYFKQTPLVVTYHPAYLLRSLPDKAKAWEDLCLARSAMKQLSEERK